MNKNEIVIREVWEKLNDRKSGPVCRKKKQKGKDPEVDQAMNKWVFDVTERDIQISGFTL